MGVRLDRLLSIAGPPLGPLGPATADISGVPEGSLGAELSEFLACVNGFYAFESALHVFPAGPVPADRMSAQRWNDNNCWRDGYGELAQGLFFFAEDVFGGQFALRGSEVVSFEPETASIDVLAPSLEAWADRLLEDYPLLTGFPLAHQWQQRHGQLPAGIRLLPKRPFVLGGEFTIENLYAMDAVSGMRLRGEVATQIRHLPDGTKLRLVPVGRATASGGDD